MRSSRYAFTLIELLVVVTIIAVLVSLVFGFAPGMIKKARQTQSLSNLRQVAVGLTLYAADNEGHFPPRAADGSSTSRWPELVNGYLQDKKVFAAPDDPSNFLKTHRDPLSNSTNNTSYIMNGGLDPDGGGSSGAESKPLILAGIEQPSKTILLGVIYNDGNFYLDVQNGDQNNIDPKLFGTSNAYAFMDGSARIIEEKEYKDLDEGDKAYLWLIHKPDR